MVEASLVKLPLYECHLDFTGDQSTLVQVMAWCSQATSHYLSQCWPRSLSPCGITRPQCVNQSEFFMTLMTSKITGNSTGCSTTCSIKQHIQHQSIPLLAICEGNPPVTGEFPSQMASNLEIISMLHIVVGVSSRDRVRVGHLVWWVLY